MNYGGIGITGNLFPLKKCFRMASSKFEYSMCAELNHRTLETLAPGIEEFLGFWCGFPALFCVEQSRYGCGLDRLQRELENGVSFGENFLGDFRLLAFGGCGNDQKLLF
ncbi:hypothetical protein CDAR_47111 [Caerostris darwini]|uniref:Uncharacterized protein n=1 Tax=Caerostris darwini TaxID=1538125 RepID=A0AAV4UA88_9ARAC|nr:hypothetical protein CDAR_47111 [Caerostris darwini]